MLSKGLLVLLVAYLTVATTHAKSDRCNFDDSSSIHNDLEKECSSSEYSSYVDCVRKRSKRYADCYGAQESCDEGENCGASEQCGQCDCNYCSYNECDSNCSSCCSGYAAPCSTRTCCHATCQSTCRTSSCRRGCRSRCHKSIEQSASKTSSSITNAGSNTVSSDQKSSATNQGKHNITTVINLKTVVNNTNIVDMPIRFNNTNLNNITLESPKPGEINVNMQSQPPQNIIQYPEQPQQPPQQPQQPIIQYQPPYQPQQCCNVISPRQCVPIQEPPYQNCYHTKSKVCGEVCTASTMHAEPHRVCDQQIDTHKYQEASNCHEQVAYIPQPQPRCFSTSQWPYVNCMVAKPSCGGCYTHLIHGGSAPSNCPNSCYDNGINVGPSGSLYGQGPLYQQPIPQQYGGYPHYSVYPTQPGQGGQGGVFDAWGLQSIGPWFNEGGQNVSLQQYHANSGQAAPYKHKRHLEDGKETSSEDDSLEYKVEEYPIKMD